MPIYNPFKSALKKALGGEFEAKINLFKFKESISLSNYADVLFPWRTENITTFGVKGRMETSGGVQFLRFVTSGEGKANLTNPLGKTGKIGASIKLQKGAVAASAEREVKIHFPREGGKPLIIPYYLKDHQVQKKTDLGQAKIIVTAKVHGFLAASLCLASEINLGNTDDGELGIRGSGSVITNVNEYKQNRLSTAGTQDPSLSVSGKVEAKVFAGLQIGGSVTCQFMWYPPNGGNPLNLFKVGGGMDMLVGAGYELLLQCSFYKGKFVLITRMGGSVGVGFNGKIVVELNPVAMDAFLGALLAITKKSGFSRFAFFDEKEGSAAFEHFNRLLTVAVSFGLTLGQVALLPFTIVTEMDKAVSDKKNAFFVANFILPPSKAESNAKINADIRAPLEWKTNMPAETLCKLLAVLINYHDFPFISIRAFRMEERKNAAERNEKQRKAILQILAWLVGVDNGYVLTELIKFNQVPFLNNEQINCFENALQRMDSKILTDQDDADKWLSYANNVIKLRDFFLKAAEDDFEEVKTNATANEEGYMARLQSDINTFMGIMKQLTKQTQVLKEIPLPLEYMDIRGNNYLEESELNKPQYIAIKANEEGQFAIEGYRLIQWENIKPTKLNYFF